MSKPARRVCITTATRMRLLLSGLLSRGFVSLSVPTKKRAHSCCSIFRVFQEAVWKENSVKRWKERRLPSYCRSEAAATDAVVVWLQLRQGVGGCSCIHPQAKNSRYFSLLYVRVYYVLTKCEVMHARCLYEYVVRIHRRKIYFRVRRYTWIVGNFSDAPW